MLFATNSLVLILLFAVSGAAPIPNAADSATTTHNPNESLLHIRHCPTVKELIAGAAIKSLPDNALFWNDEVPVDVVLPFARAHNRKIIRDVFPEPQRDHVVEVCQREGVDPWDRMSKAYASLASGEAWVLDRPASLAETGTTFSHYDKHWAAEFGKIRRLRRVKELYRVNLDAQNQVVLKHKIWS